MTAIDKDYYARRAREEREREQAAATVTAKKVHAELAERYEQALRVHDSGERGGREADGRAVDGKDRL